MNTYTDEMIAELRAAGPINNDFAVAFAERNGLSVQSVRQKAVRDEEIGYQAKPKVRKDGSPVQNKGELVAEIAALVERDAELYSSLENANRQILVDIRDALQAAVAIAESE